MTEIVTIAIDAMGGDYGLDATIPGAILALEYDPNLKIILFVVFVSANIIPEYFVDGSELPLLFVTTAFNPSFRSLLKLGNPWFAII